MIPIFINIKIVYKYLSNYKLLLNKNYAIMYNK